jgi:hypothetical protein
VAQVRKICQRVLRDAKVKRHAFWRYSVIWKKPQDAVSRERVQQ